MISKYYFIGKFFKYVYIKLKIKDKSYEKT